MGWPKGKPRPEGAGRQKGVPNKRTAEVMEILAKLPGGDGKIGFDPLKELVECYHRTANTDEVMHLSIKCLEVLMPYCYSKKTAEAGFSAADVALIEQIKQLASRPKQEIIEIAQREIKKLNE